ncbi:NADH:ubiquinone oxidoreductase complex I intermediate-associated protein 30, partial [Saccharata proteae CBS 121410]
WDPADWTASDDRVRGGKSQSYFDCSKHAPTARFHGELDIKTLGGAGFASQRTTGEDRVWNLDEYDGIQLNICEADDKQYTFILKDEILQRNPENGREQATLSYEYDFRVPKVGSEVQKTSQVFIPWKELKATYRGREKKDAPTPDLKNIKRMSLMMRSFFGTQEGHFSLTLSSIAAV